MIDWFLATLRSHPSSPSSFIGDFIGDRLRPWDRDKVAGFSLGNVTATLLAAVDRLDRHHRFTEGQGRLLHPVAAI